MWRPNAALHPMSLTLYYHPLSSFCHKVLVALYESETQFRPVIVNLGDPASSAEMLSYWPLGKFPVLRDEQRDEALPETSIIIEYLAQHHQRATRLLPTEFDAALRVRLWDRFFDLYVNVPMGKIVVDRLRPAGREDPTGVAEAKQMLERAYDIAERQLEGRRWATGDTFTMADCAAAPALFYADIVLPFASRHPNLAAYFERLLTRPSFARVLEEAGPYFPMFPLYDHMPARFRDGGGRAGSTDRP